MIKYIYKIMSILTGMFIVITNIHAATPWIYSAPNPSIVNVSSGGSASVTYTVTSQTKLPKSLAIETNPIGRPATPGLSASTCNLPTKGSTCTLTITINGNQIPASGLHAGPYMCQANSNGTPNPNQCYQPSAANVLNVTKNVTQPTSLAVSVSSLVLSVAGYTEFGIPGTPTSGVARTITVMNTGSNPATNLSLNYPLWPAGTTAIDTCPATLAAGATCTITITPGATATSDGTNPCTTGVEPTPQLISISADNANTVTSAVVVLGYACIYQNGYVYAFDDTTPTIGSVGGKAAATADQGAIGWGADALNAPSAIYAISEISTTLAPDPIAGQQPGQVACDGAADGSCDTNNIYVYYENFATGAPINLSTYATGLCKQPISGYSDWYLPAICEMGYDTFPVGSNCGTAVTPVLQNMQSSLVNTLTLLLGLYWASTENSANPVFQAWTQNFGVGGVSTQNLQLKNTSILVRCSRNLSL